MIQPCEKQCKECPFSNKSLKGWLGDLKVDQIRPMLAIEYNFPCHLQLKKYDNEDLDIINQKVQKGTIKICRGYIESIVKSLKMPRRQDLQKVYIKVKEAGISPNTLSINEFEEYHKTGK